MSNYKQKNYACSSNETKHFSLKDKYEGSSEQVTSKKSRHSAQSKELSESTESSLDLPETQSTDEVKTETILVEDPNELGAKLIRAELMGDDELVESLKKRLEVARAQAEKTKPADKTNKTNNEYNKSKKNSQNQHHNKNQNVNRERHENRQTVNNKAKNLDEDQRNSQSKKQKTSDSSCNMPNENKNVVESCELCFENAQKHLIASIGKHCYLCLPSSKSLVTGHCYICPINHCSSSVTCDEEVWAEIQDFRKALVKMFDSKRMDCVFYEMYTNQKKYSHLIIECVPLDMSCSNMAPIYFKKAILEAESEWAENKSIIDLKNQNIRKSIPRNMPYFNVNFGLSDGYAHIIENSEAFPECFAKEVIGGILDLDPMDWRRPPKDTFNAQSQKVIEFLKWWKSYEINKK